jgi:hypothetical protein
MKMDFRGLKSSAPIILAILALIAFYIINLGSPLMTRLSDIKWLNQLTSPFTEKSPTLFLYISWFFTQFSLSPINSITLSILIVFILLPLATFYLAKGILGDYFASFLAGFIVLTFPSHVWSTCSSHYSSLLGSLLTSFALMLLCKDMSSIKKASLIALISFLTSFADLVSGLILFATCLTYWLSYSILERRFSLAQFYPLFSAPSLILFPFTEVLTFEPPATPLPITLGVLASVVGLFLLLRNRKIFLLTASWLFSSMLVSGLVHFPLIYLYASLPIAVSSLALLPECRKEAVVLSVEGEEHHVEVDVGKVAGLALLCLIVLSTLASTCNVVGSATLHTTVYVERYGDEDLLDALNWLNGHTPENAVILAEHPLSTWIQSYTNRPTITNYPVEFAQNIEELIRSYDADTVLNANYEVRNRFMRLRDWESVAPQRSPSLASSNGEGYVDFLYLDENHATVTYVYNGETFEPDFYQYLEKTTSWVLRSGEQAVLQHTYVLKGGVTIVKRLSLQKESHSTIEYNITSSASTLRSFSIKLWIPWERRLGFTQVSGNQFGFTLDSGEYEVEFQGNIADLKFGYDEEWSQPRVYAAFKPVNNQVQVKIVVKALNVKPVKWAEDDVFSASAKELLEKYNVGYAVIPTAVKREFMDRFGLDNVLFKSQHENSKLTIYKVTL